MKDKIEQVLIKVDEGTMPVQQALTELLVIFSVGGPASASALEGEQLGNEGWAKSVCGRCDCGNYKDPDDSGTCDNCFGYC